MGSTFACTGPLGLFYAKAAHGAGFIEIKRRLQGLVPNPRGVIPVVIKPRLLCGPCSKRLGMSLLPCLRTNILVNSLGNIGWIDTGPSGIALPREMGASVTAKNLMENVMEGSNRHLGGYGRPRTGCIGTVPCPVTTRKLQFSAVGVYRLFAAAWVGDKG